MRAFGVMLPARAPAGMPRGLVLPPRRPALRLRSGTAPRSARSAAIPAGLRRPRMPGAVAELQRERVRGGFGGPVRAVPGGASKPQQEEPPSRAGQTAGTPTLGNGGEVVNGGDGGIGGNVQAPQAPVLGQTRPELREDDPPAPVARTIGINEERPACDLRPEWGAGTILPASTLDLYKLNLAPFMSSEYRYTRDSVQDYRKSIGLPPLKEPLDAFRVGVWCSLGDFLKAAVGGKAKAAAMASGASDADSNAAAAKALEPIAPLIEATSAPFKYVTDRHVHMLPELGGRKGQRVLYIGNEDPWGEGAEVHALKRVLVDLSRRGAHLDKNNVYALVNAGGGPEQVAAGNGITHGVTHGGRISLAWNDELERVLEKRGEPDVADLDGLKILWYDQPANYAGNPTTVEDDSPCWWSLTVFDPSTIAWRGAEGGEMPDTDTFKAWAENTEMWSALDALVVPYPEDTAEDRMAGRRTFSRNPVEIKKATDLGPWAEAVLGAACSPEGEATRSEAMDTLAGYAEYCEEGKVNVKNAGLNVVLNRRSVEEGRISEAAFRRLEAMAAEFEGRSPEEAWGVLADKGYVNAEQMTNIRYRGYHRQRLRVLDDRVRPWTDYGPKGVETDPGRDGCGLFTRPVTVVTLFAHFMASNFPREEVGKGFAASLNGVLGRPDGDPARAALVGMLQAEGLGEDETGKLAGALAADFQGAFIQVQKGQLHEKLRYNKMDGADKKKVDHYIEAFTKVVTDRSLTRDAAVVSIKELNEEFRDVFFPSLLGKMGDTKEDADSRGLQFYSPLQGIEGPKGAPFMPEYVGHQHLAFMVKDRYRTSE
ncbi:unnamed protein product [Ostreobium quekettii]|uniref:Uncharacterized protein n=1 Tax=Ostreobium quekettii TaxID=121088 RepID=A0A8S1IMF0_9CHLO|nr:unnamed protein product [Ostreobium quekettii]